MDRAGDVDLWAGGLDSREPGPGSRRTGAIGDFTEARPQPHSALDGWGCAPPDHPAHNPYYETDGDERLGHTSPRPSSHA